MQELDHLKGLESNVQLIVDIAINYEKELIKLNEKCRKLEHIIKLKDVTIDELNNKLLCSNFNGTFY